MKTEKKINMPCIFIRYFLFYFFNNLVPKDTISLCVKKKINTRLCNDERK